MKAAKLVFALVSCLVTIPIQLWLIYQILVRVQATELMWFLYWAYVPVVLFTVILSRIIDAAGKSGA